MPRLFVAIELPDEVSQQLDDLCGGPLGASVPGARWVADGPFHLTLHFAGQVDGPQARRLEQGLHGVRADPFELELRGVGHFPPRGAPRVLWAGVAPNDGLATLYRRIQSCLSRLGLATETRRFAPHVTLARLTRSPLPDVIRFLEDNGRFASGPFPVTDFQLFSSVLGRRAAQHRVEASYPLMGTRA